MTSTPADAKPTAAQKALTAATKKTSDTYAETEVARERITIAEQALEAAKAEALEALAAKSSDPKATHERIQAARQGISAAESDLEWAQVQLQAAEVVSEQARDDEIVARRRVVADEYLAAHAEHVNPNSRERVLLAQVTEALAELLTTIPTRKQLFDRLNSEHAHFPPEEQFPHSQRLPTYDTQRGQIPVFVGVPEIAEAIKAGLAQ